MEKAIPARRLGTVEEVAYLLVYLSSPAATFITGQTYYIDGGQTLFGDILNPWDVADAAVSKL